MALLHSATVTPTKLELLASWLPAQTWYRGDSAAAPERAGAFRFDDPLGEVGVETLLVRAGNGPVHQVPLTYRAEPFADGEPWLIGTVEHSVLGRRWVYDACGDPVYVATLAGTILSGGTQAQEFIEVDGRLQARDALAQVEGTGSVEIDIEPIGSLTVETDEGVTYITDGRYELHVLRTPGTGEVPASAEALSGTWAGQAEPIVLAYAEEI